MEAEISTYHSLIFQKAYISDPALDVHCVLYN